MYHERVLLVVRLADAQLIGISKYRKQGGGWLDKKPYSKPSPRFRIPMVANTVAY